MKRIIPFILLTFSLTGCTLINRFTNKTSSISEKDNSAESYVESYHADDFKDEVEVDSLFLSSSIRGEEVTGSDVWFKFTFRSKTSKGFKNGKGTFIVQITDDNYPGEITDLTDYYYSNVYQGKKEEVDGEYLPVFDGSIAFVTSDYKKEVYLPSKMTYAGKLVINITGISKNALTKDGEGLQDGTNVWGNVKEVYIPETIKFADEGAFTGNSDAKIYYEGEELPEGFEDGWTDVKEGNVICDPTSYPEKKNSERSIGISTDIDIKDKYNRPISFILGCKESENFQGKEYDRPLVIQYDLIHSDGTRETRYEALPLCNTVGNSYDSVGPISALSYSRTITINFKILESIDSDSIYFHNIMRTSNDLEIDTSTIYCIKAKKMFS